VDNTRTVYCWGYNFYGQVGDGSATTRRFPVPVGTLLADTVAAGADHSCALDTVAGGEVRCWGDGNYGALGDPTRRGFFNLTAPAAPIQPQRFTQISVGANATCGRNTDGVAMCWGQVFEGIGAQSTSLFASPQVAAGGVRALQVETNGLATCVVTPDKDLRCWGYMAGNGNYVELSPVRPAFPQGRGFLTPP
jgi:alpha-tubulin suppressor-like RCC1 family protein